MTEQKKNLSWISHHRLQEYHRIWKRTKEYYPWQKNHDVNKNEVEFIRKIKVEAEKRRIWKKLTIFITEREDMKPLLGMDYVREIYGMI